MTELGPHFQRAWMLLQQGRYDLAEQELHQALLQHPDSGRSHALLALCLTHLDRHQEANREAENAVGLAPDDDFCHYARGVVLTAANCYPEAEAAIKEAIALNSSSAGHFSQLGIIMLQQRRWAEALAAAEQGLQIDPEHDGCANIRSIALVKLGRRTEAADALQGALARDPEDAWTHANLGWTLIEEGKYEPAMEHFREALRLEPDLEHARQGIVTAMKARSIFYRPLLNYFLWVQKLKDRYAWFLIIGLYLLMQTVTQFGRQHPELWPVLVPLIIAYMGFVYTSWLGDALFNLVLCTHRFGRLALSADEKKTSLCVGLGLLAALTVLALSVVYPGLLFPGICLLLATLPLSLVFRAESGWPRWSIVGMAALLAVMGLSPILLLALQDSAPPAVLAPLAQITLFSNQNLGVVAIATQIGSQLVAARRPRRATPRRI